MCLAKKMNLKVNWQYIVFPYNKKYMKKCIKIAKKLKIHLSFIISERE
jgi:hypothetical protein